ncbi:carboxymuconolactone decarboxylase family protein [Microbacterium capsulatum]|uniref:Carboxymuconolactone decarboxylase family protein n=1 Tax=Microbacterium capsulatum TaxID=3041921 RepID=A0ABU0XE40_9MICO|nr:carboxymuconolactone decarboxylase family protein [Microbacterium sp. ASV81]MDQ4213389.1 carboxymuconolactone decarboxylase family protein [Microbacterium sp. ASV81]
MTNQTRVPATAVTGLYGGIVKFATKKMFGRVPESIGVLWHHRPVFTDMMGFGRKAEKWHELDQGLSTLAAMASAATVGCSFCLDLHYFLARDHGLDEDKAREVPIWRESTRFTPLERRVMEYAEAMSQTPPAVTDELSDELLAAIGAPALLELAAKVGFLNATARMNIALGIHSDGFADACGLAPLATAAPAGVASQA